MNKTVNLGLNKPTYDETADIAALNENADIVDAALAGKVDKEPGKVLVSDGEKAAWDAKETPAGAQAKADAAEAAAKAYTDAYVGDKADLLTTAKSNIVSAVNELFTDVSDGKQAIATAITGKGGIASGSDTFPVLAGKIEDIPAGGEYGTAGPAQVLAPYTIGTEGGLVTGTIPSKAAQTYTPGTADQTIAANQFLTGIQTITGDADLIAANIKSGVNIFGVNGSLPTGKKYASGNVAVPLGDSKNFTTPGGGVVNSFYATVSGLTFLPSLIVVILQDTSDPTKRSVTTYSGYSFPIKIGSTNYATEGKIAAFVSTNEGVKIFSLTGSAYVTSTGFCLPVLSLWGSASWYAWE